MRLRIWFCCVAVSAMLVGATPANAAIFTFSNLAAWQAATTGASTITFEENAPGGFTDHTPSATFSGVTFTINGGNLFTIDPAFDLFTIDPAFDPFFALIGTGDVLAAQIGATLMTITPLNATAFAFNYLAFPSQTLTLTLSTGDVVTIPTVASAPGFFGLTSTATITGFTIGFADFLNIDNFATATRAASVPEPTSLVLLSTGLLCAAAYTRRRARRQ